MVACENAYADPTFPAAATMNVASFCWFCSPLLSLSLCCVVVVCLLLLLLLLLTFACRCRVPLLALRRLPDLCCF